MADITPSQQDIGGASNPASSGVVGANEGAGIALKNAASFIGMFGRNSGGGSVATYAQRAKEQGNLVTAEYAERALAITDAVHSEQIGSSEGMRKLTAEFRKLAAANPQYVGDLTQAHKDIVATAGLGKVLDEGTQAEQEMAGLRTEAINLGILPPGASPAEEAAAIQLVQQRNLTLANLEMTQAQNNTAKSQLQLNEAHDNAYVAATEARRAKSEQALGQQLTAMADIQNQTVNLALNGILNNADDDPVAKVVQMRTFANQQIAELESFKGKGNDALVTGQISTIERTLELYVQQADGTLDRSAAENLRAAHEANTTLKLMQDPDTAAVLLTSRLNLGGSIAGQRFLLDHLPAVLGKVTEMAGGAPSLVFGGRNDTAMKEIEKGVTTTVLTNVTDVNRGKASNTQKDQTQVLVEHAVMSVGVQGTDPELVNYQSAIKFLADPAMGQYLRENPISAEAQDRAVTLLTSMLGTDLLPMMKKEMQVASVQAEWNGGIVFRGGEEGMNQITGMPTQDGARRLNQKLSPVFNQFVRALANLQGMSTDAYFAAQIQPMISTLNGDTSNRAEDILEGIE